MENETPLITIIDAATGEVIIREMTAEEIAAIPQAEHVITEQ